MAEARRGDVHDWLPVKDSHAVGEGVRHPGPCLALCTLDVSRFPFHGDGRRPIPRGGGWPADCSMDTPFRLTSPVCGQAGQAHTESRRQGSTTASA